ncbi:Metal-independent alpha-mannosidase, variant 2 [Balamuthia mandrillaris]
MNQVLPYVPFATQDKPLSLLLCGLIKRSVANVLWDPYANAFNYANEGGPNQGDTRKPPMTLHVYEGKYELDSLLAVLKLSYQYWNATQSASCFDSAWLQAVTLIVNTMMVQQAGTEETLANPPYLFARQTTVATDTLMLQMQGPPAKRCGLVKTAFRPSDDATTLPFNIASNAMAVVELQHLSEMLLALNLSPLLAKQALLLANTIQQAINSVGIIGRTDVGRVYAYEADGFGSALFMDDANLPSLLSLPYLGYVAREDPLYLNTRKLVLSAANPYFSSGTVAAGVGSPHTGLSYIWPMALIMQVPCIPQWLSSFLVPLSSSLLLLGHRH